jgi:hypothetical protein
LLPESMHQTATCSKETAPSNFSSWPMCLPKGSRDPSTR